jgi:nucleolar complex protein 3
MYSVNMKSKEGKASKLRGRKHAKTKTSHHAAPSNAKVGAAIVNSEEDIQEMSDQEKYDLIAEISESILEDPSTAFSSAGAAEGGGGGGTSKIRRLLQLATPAKNGNDEYIARLSIMSLLAIFQDILPTYRIRLPTAAELAVKVSKETKKNWDYERGLLHHYQLYLKLLEKTWERGSSNNSSGQQSPLGVAAILSLCELLKAASHFNFRGNILAVVVRHMNNRKCPEVGDACCAAISHVFSQDAQGDAALEAARLVAKMIRDRKFCVRAAVLRTFLSLPLRVHVDEAEAAKLAAAVNAKKRKRNREEAEIEGEMREGSTSVDKILLARSQSDTLQVVTLTYFRILKSEDLTTDHIAELLPPALKGLAKFAHLINMDTVMDLLAVLKALLRRVDDLPLDAALNCILTAFQTLQGPGRELQIDQKEYITPLYSQLPR